MLGVRRLPEFYLGQKRSDAHHFGREALRKVRKEIMKGDPDQVRHWARYCASDGRVALLCQRIHNRRVGGGLVSPWWPPR